MNLRGDSALAAVVGLGMLSWFTVSAYSRPSDRTDSPPLRLEINTATVTDWLHVDGVGDTLASRIVEDRTSNGPFASIDDLTRVRGIGEKSVESMRPFLRIRTEGSHKRLPQSTDK